MNTFILPEDGSSKKYALATYYIELPKEENIIDKAKKMALGQTLGTWVEVPGISAEMQEIFWKLPRRNYLPSFIIAIAPILFRLPIQPLTLAPISLCSLQHF